MQIAIRDFHFIFGQCLICIDFAFVSFCQFSKRFQSVNVLCCRWAWALIFLLLSLPLRSLVFDVVVYNIFRLSPLSHSFTKFIRSVCKFKHYTIYFPRAPLFPHLHRTNSNCYAYDFFLLLNSMLITNRLCIVCVCVVTCRKCTLYTICSKWKVVKFHNLLISMNKVRPEHQLVSFFYIFIYQHLMMEILQAVFFFVHHQFYLYNQWQQQ